MMNAKKAVGLVVAVVAGIVAYYVAFHGVKGLFPSVESKIDAMVTDLNKRLPMQVDPVTRWDRVEREQGKSFSYIYTVTTPLTDEQKRDLRSGVSQRALAAPEMKPIFDAGVTVWYKYYDPGGKKVLEFSVKR
jgi:hypothetical protein